MFVSFLARRSRVRARTTEPPASPSCRAGTFLRLLSCLALVSSSASALAQPGQAPAEAPAEAPVEAPPSHPNIFVRGGFGIGYASMDVDGESPGFETRGVAIVGGLALGSRITQDLALHFSWFSNTVPGARAETNGVSMGGSRSFSVGGAGVGATYRAPSIGAFVSFAVGIGWNIAASGGFPETGWGDWGLGSEVMLGREWTINDRFALGPAAQAIYARTKIEVDGVRAKYNGFGGGLLLSMTFRGLGSVTQR